MRELLTILMRRDGLTREEALETLRDAREAVLEAIQNGDDPEDAFMDITGLEPDYIMNIILTSPPRHATNRGTTGPDRWLAKKKGSGYVLKQERVRALSTP